MASLRVVLVVFCLLFAVGVAGELVFKKRKLDGSVKIHGVQREEGPLRMLLFAMSQVLSEGEPARFLDMLESHKHEADVVVLTGIKGTVQNRWSPLQKVCDGVPENLPSGRRNIVLSRPSVVCVCSGDYLSVKVHYRAASFDVFLPSNEESTTRLPSVESAQRFLRLQVTETLQLTVITASAALKSAYSTTISDGPTITGKHKMVKVLVDTEKDVLEDIHTPRCELNHLRISELFDDLSAICGNLRFVVTHLAEYTDQPGGSDTAAWIKALKLANGNQACAAALVCIQKSSVPAELKAKGLWEALKHSGRSDEIFYSKRNGAIKVDHDSIVVDPSSVWRLGIEYSIPASWLAHLHRKTVDTVAKAFDLIMHIKEKATDQTADQTTDQTTAPVKHRREEFDFTNWLDPEELGRLEGHFGLRAFLCWIDRNRDTIRKRAESSPILPARFCSFTADSHTNRMLENAAAFYALSQTPFLFPAGTGADDDAAVLKRIFPNYVHNENWERDPLLLTAEAYPTVNQVLSRFGADIIPDLRTLESNLPRVVSLQRWLQKRPSQRTKDMPSGVKPSLLPSDSLTTLFVCVDSAKLNLKSSYFVNEGFLFATSDLPLLMSKCLGTMVMLTRPRGSLTPLEDTTYLLPPNSIFSQSFREFQGRETVLLTPYESLKLMPLERRVESGAPAWELQSEPRPKEAFEGVCHLEEMLKFPQALDSAPSRVETDSQISRATTGAEETQERGLDSAPSRVETDTQISGKTAAAEEAQQRGLDSAPSRDLRLETGTCPSVPAVETAPALPSCSCRLCKADCSPPHLPTGGKCVHFDTLSMGGFEQDLDSFCALSLTHWCTATEDGCKFRMDTLQTVVDSHVSHRLRHSGDGAHVVLSLLHNLVQASPLNTQNLHAMYQLIVTEESMHIDEQTSLWALALAAGPEGEREAEGEEETEAQLAQEMGSVAAGLRAMIPFSVDPKLKSFRKHQQVHALVDGVVKPLLGKPAPEIVALQTRAEKLEAEGYFWDQTALSEELKKVKESLLNGLEQQLQQYEAGIPNLKKCFASLKKVMTASDCTKSIPPTGKTKKDVCIELSDKLCSILQTTRELSVRSVVTLLRQVPLIVPETLLKPKIKKHIEGPIASEMRLFMSCVRRSVAKQKVMSMMADVREGFEASLTNRMQQTLKQQRYALAAARYSLPVHEVELAMLFDAPVELPVWLQEVVNQAAGLPTTECLPYHLPVFAEADKEAFELLNSQQQLGVEGLIALVDSCMKSSVKASGL